MSEFGFSRNFPPVEMRFSRFHGAFLGNVRLSFVCFNRWINSLEMHCLMATIDANCVSIFIIIIAERSIFHVGTIDSKLSQMQDRMVLCLHTCDIYIYICGIRAAIYQTF